MESVKPGYDYLTHEALHMASFLEDAIEKQLCDHPAILDNDEWFKLAEGAMISLQKLYQKIGATM